MRNFNFSQLELNEMYRDNHQNFVVYVIDYIALPKYYLINCYGTQSKYRRSTACREEVTWESMRLEQLPDNFVTETYIHAI